MSRLARDGTAKPVSRDQILRCERGPGNVHFFYSADHEQDWQPYPVDSYSAIISMTIHISPTLQFLRFTRCLFLLHLCNGHEGVSVSYVSSSVLGMQVTTQFASVVSVTLFY